MSVYCAVMAFSFNFMCVFQNVLLYYKSSGVDPAWIRILGDIFDPDPVGKKSPKICQKKC